MWLSRLPALFTHPEKKLQLPRYGKIEMETIPCTGSWLGKDRSSVGRQDKENVLTQKPENYGRKKQSAFVRHLPTSLLSAYMCFYLAKGALPIYLFIYLFLGIKNQRRSKVTLPLWQTPKFIKHKCIGMLLVSWLFHLHAWCVSDHMSGLHSRLHSLERIAVHSSEDVSASVMD